MIETAADPLTGQLPERYGVREPWLAAGDLRVEKARAVRSGLGEPSVDDAEAGVTVHDLAEIVSRLLAEAGPLNADRLFSLARQYRDEL